MLSCKFMEIGTGHRLFYAEYLGNHGLFLPLRYKSLTILTAT